MTMRVFVQARDIPRAFRIQSELQSVLRNVGQILHASFHDGYDEKHCNAVLYLETGAEFRPSVVHLYGQKYIHLTPIPDKFVRTIIGDDLETHLNTPAMYNIGKRIWD